MGRFCLMARGTATVLEVRLPVPKYHLIIMSFLLCFVRSSEFLFLFFMTQILRTEVICLLTPVCVIFFTCKNNYFYIIAKICCIVSKPI